LWSLFDWKEKLFLSFTFSSFLLFLSSSLLPSFLLVYDHLALYRYKVNKDKERREKFDEEDQKRREKRREKGK